jgi:hypothetical protein
MGYLYEACDQISDFPIRFLLPVCLFCWLLYTFNIHLYMHMFRRIFLSNYWRQESYIWSQSSYRYAILWEMFLYPSDSYFLLAEVGIWWVQKRFPWYGVTIWSLWLNIRFLLSIVGENNAFLLPVCRPSWFLYTLNIYAHFSSHFSHQLLMAEIWYLVTGSKTLPTIWYTYITLVTIYQISAINSNWEKCDEKYLTI